MKSIFNIVIISLFSFATLFSGTTEEKLALEAQRAEAKQQVKAEKVNPIAIDQEKPYLPNTVIFGEPNSRAVYTLTVGGGTWDSEITWDISSGGEIITSGAAGAFDLDLEDGDYTFNGFDAYGDGWNGGSATISSADGNLYTFVVEGTSGSWDFSLPGEVDTNVYGCMLADAPNYNADATVDDGSCEYFAGADYGYWNAYYSGYAVGCGLYYVFPNMGQDNMGDGTCDDFGNGQGLACDAFGCDGGDCADCAGDCLGSDSGTECWDGSSECDAADCPSACSDTECTLEMIDAYGDSWNGNVWSSGDQSAANDGSTGTDPQYITLCFDLGAANTYICDGGTWQSEVSWTLTCGDDVITGGAPADGCFGDCNSVVYGCTDMAACNYNADATDDDGSCIGPDCAGECDGGAVVDECGECNGDGSSCADCLAAGGNLSWIGDGYCDSGNNNDSCGYDAGDCCPGDCEDGDLYECATYGGDCIDCSDPDSADNAEGGECFDTTAGCTDPDADNYNPDATTDDGSCLYDGCAAGTIPGCSEQDMADGDCAGAGWIGDGICDGNSEAYGVNFCCYDLDGGDCTEAECSAPEAWDASITNLTAVGVAYDDTYYYTGIHPAIQWDWDDLSDGDDPPATCEDQGLVTCSDGTCAATAEECPATTCADGSDPLVDCVGTEFCDEDCANESYDGCVSGESNWTNDGYCDDGAWGLELACTEYNCDSCACGPDYSSNGDGCNADCSAPDPAECADSFTISLGMDFDDDGYDDDCYDDGYGNTSGYLLFDWDGGCLATSVSGAGYDQDGECDEGTGVGCDFVAGDPEDFSALGFTGGFYWYGWDSNYTDYWTVTFTDVSASSEATTGDCDSEPTTECALGQFDCLGDGSECIPGSYVCDGSTEFCNAEWPADCSNGADEGLDLCDYTDDCDGRLASNDKNTNLKLRAKAINEYRSSKIVDAPEDKVLSNHTSTAVTIVNIATGEIIPGTSNGNRSVSYTINVSCDACLDGGPWSGFWDIGQSDFLVYGFDDGSTVCGNVTGSSTELGNTAASEDACANAGGGGDDCMPGDTNGDDFINVLDIVAIVGYIVNDEANFALECADVNGDGVVNVLDIVAIVQLIIGGRVDDASSAKLIKSDEAVILEANGYIGGVQMTLNHDGDFSIDLTDKAMVAEYSTVGNETILVIVAPEGEELFTYTGDFEIVDMIVANSQDRVNVGAPTEFSLSTAYPNPFNPTTSLELSVPMNGQVTVQVYNLMGQVVATLANGYMDASTYTLTWDASNVSSGMYIVKAEAAGTVSTQKLMLMK